MMAAFVVALIVLQTPRMSSAALISSPIKKQSYSCFEDQALANGPFWYSSPRPSLKPLLFSFAGFLLAGVSLSSLIYQQEFLLDAYYRYSHRHNDVFERPYAPKADLAFIKEEANRERQILNLRSPNLQLYASEIRHFAIQGATPQIKKRSAAIAQAMDLQISVLKHFLVNIKANGMNNPDFLNTLTREPMTYEAEDQLNKILVIGLEDANPRTRRIAVKAIFESWRNFSEPTAILTLTLRRALNDPEIAPTVRHDLIISNQIPMRPFLSRLFYRQTGRMVLKTQTSFNLQEFLAEYKANRLLHEWIVGMEEASEHVEAKKDVTLFSMFSLALAFLFNGIYLSHKRLSNRTNTSA